MPHVGRYATAALVISVGAILAGCSSDTLVAAPATLPTTAPGPTATVEPAPTAEPSVAPTPTAEPTVGPTATATPLVIEPTDPFVVKDRLARTLNLGASLEVPKGAEPLSPLDLDAFADIASQGFSAVRIPVRFADWADLDPPYAIDDELFELVDSALHNADANGLAAIIDVHHYLDIFDDPATHGPRLVAMWRQIAERYRLEPSDQVVYEILNEPNTNLTPEFWNPIVAEAVAAVREVDPARTIIVGPTRWNDHRELELLALPDDDNLIATFHYYLPFPFTHQGAGWIPNSERWIGTAWGPQLEIPVETAESGGEEAPTPAFTTAGDAVRADFELAASWAAERGVPMLLGEFGVVDMAARADRIAWIEWVRETAEANDFAWAFWEWTGARMGIRDAGSGAWDAAMIAALGLG